MPAVWGNKRGKGWQEGNKRASGVAQREARVGLTRCVLGASAITILCKHKNGKRWWALKALGALCGHPVVKLAMAPKGTCRLHIAGELVDTCIEQLRGFDQQKLRAWAKGRSD